MTFWGAINKESTHGTLVAGVIAAEAGNDKGFRGIVNPRRFYAVGKDELPRRLGKYPYQRIATFIEKTCHIYKVMNMSHVLSPIGYDKKRRRFNMMKHLDVLDEYRKVFKKCSNTLFVISAGNNKVDAKKNNGGIHYFWNPINRSEIYDPLDNVLVVGSHDGGNSKGKYKAIWDYGRSVDIYADGKLGGPKKGKNKYFTSVSGTSFSAPQVSGVATIVAGIRSYKGAAIKNALIYGQKRQVFKGYKYSKPILNAYRTIKNIKR